MVVTDNLTENQIKRVDDLKAAVKSIVDKSPALQSFCTQHTYVRYLRARGWNVQKAAAMLTATLEWRLELQPERIVFSDVEVEASSGKLYVLDHPDANGAPVVAMIPRNQNTNDPDMQIKYLIYILEKACYRAEAAGVGKMVWLIDFEGYSLKNAPPLSVQKQTLNIVQNHYPERLGEAICYHAPKLFEVTWKAMKPFIDPVTRKKITFIKRKKSNGIGNRIMSGFELSEGDIKQESDDVLGQKFDLSLLDVSFGGKGNCPFHAGKYAEKMMVEDIQRDANIARLML